MERRSSMHEFGRADSIFPGLKSLTITPAFYTEASRNLKNHQILGLRGRCSSVQRPKWKPTDVLARASVQRGPQSVLETPASKCWEYFQVLLPIAAFYLIRRPLQSRHLVLERHWATPTCRPPWGTLNSFG